MDTNIINQELIFIRDPTYLSILNEYGIYFSSNYDEYKKVSLNIYNKYGYPIKLNGNLQAGINTRIFFGDKIECGNKAFVFLMPGLYPPPSERQDRAYSNIVSAVYKYLNSDYFKQFGNIGYYKFYISLEIKNNSFLCNISVSTDRDKFIFTQKLISSLSNPNIINNINKNVYLNLICNILQIFYYHNNHIQNAIKEHAKCEKVNEMERSILMSQQMKKHYNQIFNSKNNENEIPKCSNPQMSDSHNRPTSPVTFSLNINFVGYVMNFKQMTSYDDILKGTFIDLHKAIYSYVESLRIPVLVVLLQNPYLIQSVHSGSLISCVNGSIDGAPAMNLLLGNKLSTFEISHELRQLSDFFNVVVPLVNGEYGMYRARAFWDDQLLVMVDWYCQPLAPGVVMRQSAAANQGEGEGEEESCYQRDESSQKDSDDDDDDDDDHSMPPPSPPPRY